MGCGSSTAVDASGATIPIKRYTGADDRCIEFDTLTGGVVHSGVDSYGILQEGPVAVRHFSSKLPLSERIKQDASLVCAEGYYIGEVDSNDQPHGLGTWFHWNGDLKWKGDTFEQGKQTGKGYIHLLSANSVGDHYDGGFLEDKYHGEGRLVRRTGDHMETISEGSFTKGEFTEGTRLFPDGITRYTGPFQSDEPYGSGVQVDAQGRTYVGAFKKGLYHYGGRLTNAENKPLFDGSWDSGKRSGAGIAWLDDGSILAGEWKDDKLNGHGIRWDAEGNRIQVGLFEQSEFKKAQPVSCRSLGNLQLLDLSKEERDAKFLYPNGDYYTAWSCNSYEYPSGYGQLFNEDGKMIQQGFWHFGIETVSILKEISFLKHLDPKDNASKLASFAGSMQEQIWQDGQPLIRRHALDAPFILLLQGEAAVKIDYGGEMAEVHRLIAGDFCGESAFLSQVTPATATIIAVGEVRGVVFHRKQFQEHEKEFTVDRDLVTMLTTLAWNDRGNSDATQRLAQIQSTAEETAKKDSSSREAKVFKKKTKAMPGTKEDESHSTSTSSSESSSSFRGDMRQLLLLALQQGQDALKMIAAQQDKITELETQIDILRTAQRRQHP